MEHRFETFSMLIAKINRNMKKLKNMEMAEYGLRNPQISCLYALYHKDGMTAAELCERSDEDKATISRSLDILEKNGYLSREVVRGKRYKSPILLTEKGKAMAKKIAERVDLIYGSISLAMSEEDKAAFYRNLATVASGLEGVCKQLEEQQNNAE